MKIPFTKQQRRAFRGARKINPNMTRLEFLATPEGQRLRTPEQKETPDQMAPGFSHKTWMKTFNPSRREVFKPLLAICSPPLSAASG